MSLPATPQLPGYRGLSQANRGLQESELPPVPVQPKFRLWKLAFSLLCRMCRANVFGLKHATTCMYEGNSLTCEEEAIQSELQSIRCIGQFLPLACALRERRILRQLQNIKMKSLCVATCAAVSWVEIAAYCPAKRGMAEEDVGNAHWVSIQEHRKANLHSARCNPSLRPAPRTECRHCMT